MTSTTAKAPLVYFTAANTEVGTVLTCAKTLERGGTEKVDLQWVRNELGIICGIAIVEAQR